MTFSPLGDSGVVVTFGASIDESTLLHVRSLTAALERGAAAGIVDVVPAYATVTIFYDALAFPANGLSTFERVCRFVAEQAEKAEHSWPGLVRARFGGGKAEEPPREIELPVCYGGEFGPDLEEVARHCGLRVTEVGELHAAADYVVHAVGFTPGFPYLGGLPEKLHTPRRPTPRTQVPAGSVGIGWSQTGVYPLASPGGWQLIGRTPVALFRVDGAPPARLRVGDRVKFRAITAAEFATWK